MSPRKPGSSCSGRSSGWFDRIFNRMRDGYQEIVALILARKLRYMVVYILIVAALGFLFLRMPTSYLPDEDQGFLYSQVVLPAGSTREQTEQVLNQLRDHFLVDEKEAVASVFTVAGSGFSGAGQNVGLAFIMLRDWDVRRRADLKVNALVERAMGKFSKYRNALAFAFAPPAVRELGQAGGFDFQLQDRGGLGHAKLMAARNQLLGLAGKEPRLTRVRPNGLEDVPQYRIDVDLDKGGALGVPVDAINTTISASFGGAYVNDFIQGGRVKRVYVQADAPYRMLPNDLGRLYVRNSAGTMAPFSSFASGHWFQGSPRLERFNSFPSMNIWGEAPRGKSSGEAMQAMEEIVSKLPKGIGFDWTGLSFQERMAKSQAPMLFAFSIIVIFLCLAALYESWIVPITIVLALPLGVIGGVVATSLRGLPNGVYFQIGLLTVLGLTTKNAILIVQFAMAKVDEGAGTDRCHAGGGEIAVPPDRHDLAGLRLRRPSPGHGQRGRRGSADRHRDRRPGRHGHRHLPGDLLHPPLLRGGGAAVRKEERRPDGKARTGRRDSFGGAVNMTRIMRSLLSITAVLLAGCTLAPKYTRPEAPVPGNWPSGPAYKDAQAAHEAPAATVLAWREFFTDERLQKVIETALNSNRDLRTAALNVERARALYGIQRAELLPTVNAAGNASAQRVPADLSSSGAAATTSRQYGVNLGIASWEIDFFGRIRSLKDKALEEYLATAQARHSAQILLVSGVANAYLTLAADRENLRLAQDTLENQRAAYGLIRRRYEAGILSELDTRQAQTRVDAARVDVALFSRLTAQDENALNLLAGSPVPGELLPPDLSAVSPFRGISPGMSSDVLLRRPDILQAESLLKAANANIGAARAALFPRISLTAAAGTASSELSGLFRIRLERLELLVAGRIADFRRPRMVGVGSGQGGEGNRPGPVRESHPVGIPGSGRCACSAGHGGRTIGGANLFRRCRRGNLPTLQCAVYEGDRQLPGRPRCAALPLCGATGPDLHPSREACQSGAALRGAGRGCVNRGQSISGCRRSRRSASGTPRCPAPGTTASRSSGGSRPCGSRAARSGAA